MKKQIINLQDSNKVLQDEKNKLEEEKKTLENEKETLNKPNCASVSRMKASNKQSYSGVRDNLISQGYSPCKNCNP